MSGLYFEQFEVGQRFEHAVRRTVTETDNLLFSALTMNPAALHLDAEYAKGTVFGERIVNSVFTLGLLVGLSVYETTYGTTLGNLGWEEVAFPMPVFAGDTIRAETTVVGLRDSKSRPTRLRSPSSGAPQNTSRITPSGPSRSSRCGSALSRVRI